MEFLAFFSVASLGGYVAQRLRLPAGYLLGALLSTGLISIFMQAVTYPDEVKFIARILSGILIALRVDRNDVALVKTIWKPLLLLTFGMLFYATVLAFFLTIFTTMDLTSALFACIPGGMSDMSLMAEEYGADMPQVALVQLLRLISLMLFYPFLAKSMTNPNNIPSENPKNIKATPKEKFFFTPSDAQIREGVRTFAFAGFGGLFLAEVGFPAGELLGSMFVTLFRHLKWQTGYFYPPLRPILQITVGLMIGSTMTKSAVTELFAIFPITLLTVVMILGFGVLLGYLLHKLHGSDKLTSLLAVAPGGIQEMVLLGDSLGADVSFIATLQVFRVLIVFTLFPLWISFLLHILV